MDLFNSTKFAERVNDLLKEWHVPGMAIAVVQDDKIPLTVERNPVDRSGRQDSLLSMACTLLGSNGSFDPKRFTRTPTQSTEKPEDSIVSWSFFNLATAAEVKCLWIF